MTRAIRVLQWIIEAMMPVLLGVGIGSIVAFWWTSKAGIF